MAGIKLADLFFNLADSALSRELDPAPLRFLARDRKDSGVVTATLRALPDTWHKLQRQVSLYKFLYACRAYTGKLPVEYLVAALGYNKGQGLKLARLYYSVGNADSVAVPPELEAAIDAHLLSDHRAEAVVFHNHPPTLAQAIVNHGPLASRADRQVWLSWQQKLPLLVKRVFGGGRVHFYLGENGRVREFDAPSLRDVWEFLTNPGATP